MTNIELAVAYVLVSLIGVIAGRAIAWTFDAIDSKLRSYFGNIE